MLNDLYGSIHMVKQQIFNQTFSRIPKTFPECYNNSELKYNLFSLNATKSHKTLGIFKNF